MVIKLKNVGPIIEGEVDFSRPFTLLTGLNNSGKTTMSYVAFSILNQPVKFTDLDFPEIEKSFQEGRRVFELNIFDLYVSNKLYINQVLNETSIRTINNKYKSYIKENSELTVSFNSSWVKRNLFKQIIDINIDVKNEYDEIVSLPFTSDKDSFIFCLSLDVDGIDEQILVESFERLSMIVLAGVLLPKPTFFPSERQGVTVFGKEILEKRLKNYESLLTTEDVEAFILGKSNHSQYLEPINEYLTLFREVILGNPVKSKYSEVSKYISETIMNGEVKPSKDGAFLFHPYSGDKSPIEMSYVSSTIKSLSFLSYFLKIKAEDGQIIFIDEPEINLHPRNQIYIARALGLLIDAGLNLVISTHSEYMVREINTLISLGSYSGKNDQLVNSLTDKYAISKKSLIKSQYLKVYSFNEKGIFENEVTSSGFIVPEIDDDTTSMNSRSMDIFYSINEEE